MTTFSSRTIGTIQTLSRCVSYGLMAATILLSSTLGALPAYAHNGEDHGDDAAHAAEDLVDTPVSEIEKKTNANKQKVRQATGIEPGSARSALNARPQAVNGDPGVYGSWSTPVATEVVPVFQAVLPNGKVLIWDSVGDLAAEDYPDKDHVKTRAIVWNPATNTSKQVDVQGYNIFCAGFAHLINGNILVAGGNKNKALAGIVQTHIFDWRTETWSRGKDMAAGRWYPSLATMANGEVAIIGGGPTKTEVYQTNGTIRSVTGFTNTAYGGRIYPFMTSRPDTQLQLLGPYNNLYTVNTAGNGLTVATATRDGKDRQYGSFATYDIGKHLVIGGGSITEGGVKKVPTKTAVIVNTNGSLAPTVTATSSMSQGRRQHNATILADGSVLVTGGMTSAATSGLVDLKNAITAAERWDPATGKWTVLASAHRIRQYHSTASLLPDGRVMTGGGGICGDCVENSYLEKNVEYFTPPYLYKKDGSGQLAARPTIATAPQTIAINTAFTLSSPNAASIRKVGLVGLADVTHSVDQGQRYVPLKFTASGTTLTVTGPATGGIAPPGPYMLFITDASGVPSVAKIVQVAMAPTPLMSAVRNTGANKCIDIPGATNKSKTYLQSYNCNGSKAQALTRFTNDNTLRVLGACLDVPSGKYNSGQRIWIYKCNGSAPQKWEFRTDGTIRPVSKATLCLTATSTKNKATVTIATCKNTTLQKWAW